MKELKDHIKKDFNEHKEFREAQDKLLTAIYGDGNGWVGMQKQVQEMHEIFTASNMLRKWAVRTVGFIGILAGAIITVWEVVKRIKE